MPCPDIVPRRLKILSEEYPLSFASFKTSLSRFLAFAYFFESPSCRFKFSTVVAIISQIWCVWAIDEILCLRSFLSLLNWKSFSSLLDNGSLLHSPSIIDSPWKLDHSYWDFERVCLVGMANLTMDIDETCNEDSSIVRSEWRLKLKNKYILIYLLIGSELWFHVGRSCPWSIYTVVEKESSVKKRVLMLALPRETSN